MPLRTGRCRSFSRRRCGGYSRRLRTSQPEAAYFGPEGGVRTAFIVFDLKDLSDIPSISEPLFRVAKANIQLLPVMNREDLQKGLQQIVGGAQPTGDGSSGG